MAAGANIRGITIEIGGETTKLDKALKGVNVTARTLQNQLRSVNQALKLDPKNTELLAQKQEILSKSIETTKEKLQTLKTAQEQADAAFERGEFDENKYRALQTEITKTETELKKLEDEAKSFNPTFQTVGKTVQDVGDKFKKVGDGMQSAGKKLMPATTVITGIGTASITAAMSFEDAIAKLSTIADTSEATGVPLKDLQNQIMELSDQTGISASEIANNVYDAISAGQETGDAVNFVTQSTKLATAGFADSGQALDLLTTILNAYGMEAEEVNHVSDVLINTQNKGKTTVGELASAMGRVIPTANASNVSLEQLAAGYSIMTAKGIATAETTTYMNSMINELSKSGTKASDTLKNKTGKSFQELMNDGASLADVLKILQDQASENGVAMNDMFGSAEAGKAAMSLLSGGVEEFNGLVTEMTEGVNGATDEAFGKLDTTSHQAKIALNEIKNAGIDLGQTILQMVMPYFKEFTQKIKDTTTWFKNLDDSQKQLIVKIAAIVAAVAPALLIGGKIISAIGEVTSGIGGMIIKMGGLMAKMGGLTSKMGGLSGSLSAMASPAGIVIAVIAALAAGFVYLYNTSDEFRAKINDAVEKVKNAFQGLMTALQPIFEFIITGLAAVMSGIINAAAPIIAAITNIVEFITNIISAFFALFQGDFEGFRTYLLAALQNIGNFIISIVTAYINYIIGFFEGFGVNIKTIFSDIWNGIISIFQGAGQWFSDRFIEAYTAVTTVFQGIGQWFSERWTDIKNVLAEVGIWFQTTFQTAYTNVTNVFQGIGQWFGARWTDIKNTLATVGTWFQTTFQKAYTNITNTFQGIGQWFGARWTDIKNTLATVGTWFQTTFQKAYTNITNTFQGIGQWFGARWTDIKNTLATVGTWFQTTFQKAYDSITGVFKNIGSWFKTNVIERIRNVFDGFSLADAGSRIVNSFVNAIKSIHIPRLSVSWGETEKTIAGITIKIPVPSISWNANGGIMKNPTIFGMLGGRLQGGGEAGDEAILPLDIFYKRTEGYIDDAIARATAAVQSKDTGKRGGDYVQNIRIESPKPLSAYEVARQTRNQTRNMVLQLQGVQ